MNQKSVDTKSFIKKANIVHGINKWDYSLVDYKHSKKKVKIICKDHGIFEQSPNSHLRGRKCPECAKEYHKNITKTTEQFIIDANKIHNNYYTYPRTNYINCKIKVIITCYKHGDFLQKPNTHLNGRGCRKCNRSKGEIAVAKYLDEKNIKYIDQYEFNNLPDRFYDFYLPEYNLVIEYNGEQHYKFSKFFHKTKEEMYKRRKRDLEKIEFCIENNIHYDVIAYNENIIDRLNLICDIP